MAGDNSHFMTPVIFTVGIGEVGRRGQAANASCGLAFIVFPALLRGLREPRLASLTSVAKSIPFTPFVASTVCGTSRGAMRAYGTGVVVVGGWVVVVVVVVAVVTGTVVAGEVVVVELCICSH